VEQGLAGAAVVHSVRAPVSNFCNFDEYRQLKQDHVESVERQHVYDLENGHRPRYNDERAPGAAARGRAEVEQHMFLNKAGLMDAGKFEFVSTKCMTKMGCCW
jgi:hypothetical protein